MGRPSVPVQTCTNVGCIVNVPLKDPLMAAMRTGTLLKISIQDASKRTINIDVPLLGFALAFDKAEVGRPLVSSGAARRAAQRETFSRRKRLVVRARSFVRRALAECANGRLLQRPSPI